MAAVKRNDMETAQRMADEAAKKAGYNYVRYTRNKGTARNKCASFLAYWLRKLWITETLLRTQCLEKRLMTYKEQSEALQGGMKKQPEESSDTPMQREIEKNRKLLREAEEALKRDSSPMMQVHVRALKRLIAEMERELGETK